MADLIKRLRGMAKDVRPFDGGQALTYSDCADELEKAADRIEELERGIANRDQCITEQEKDVEKLGIEIERLRAELHDTLTLIVDLWMVSASRHRKAAQEKNDEG